MGNDVEISRNGALIDRCSPATTTRCRCVSRYFDRCYPPSITKKAMPNTVAYFDISIGGKPAGRVEFDLFDDV